MLDFQSIKITVQRYWECAPQNAPEGGWWEQGPK